jgi:N-acetylmuramoyl-L-alanine amidase
MAISDQSIYNNYIARTLVKNDPADFTVGTMPKEVQEKIEEMVSADIKDNDGVIPTDLYGRVADELTPYVPGMSRNTIAGVLKTNNLFGLAGEVTSVVTVGSGLKRQQALYEKKLKEVDQRSARQFTTAEEEGTLVAASRTATGDDTGPPPPSSNDDYEYSGPPAPDINGPDNQEPTPPSFPIGTDQIEASGTFVSSVEELEYEMGSADRDISELIVHWSETFQNANLTGKQLKDLTGAGSSEYHYIIKRDGSVERGVSITKTGNHTRGHNGYSIGICFVGGLKVPSVNEVSNAGQDDLYETGAESLTRSQYNTLYQICRVFFTQYPGGQALGHSEIDPTQDDPGFEVRDYVYNLFNKQSLYLDPANEGEKSPSEILAAVDDDGPKVSEKDTTILDQKF